MIDVSNKQHGLFKGRLLAVVTLFCLSSRFGFPLDLCWLVLATQLSVWPRFDVHPHLARTVDAPVQRVATRGRLGFSHWDICLWAGEASIRRRGLMVVAGSTAGSWSSLAAAVVWRVYHGFTL